MRGTWFLLTLALCFGIGVGAAWRPLSGQRMALVEDLGFCEAELAAEKVKTSEAEKTVAKRTQDRDRMTAQVIEWQGWNEDSRKETSRLLGRIETLKADLAMFRIALEQSREEVAQAKATPKPTVTKPKAKRTKKKRLSRVRPRPQYHWFW